MAWALAIIGAALLVSLYFGYWRLEEHEQFLEAFEQRLIAHFRQHKSDLDTIKAEHVGIIERHHPHPHGPVK